MLSEQKYTPVRSARFKKGYALGKKQKRDVARLEEIVTLLANGEKLPRNCYDHNLTGNLAGKRECHIEPDWLLVYSIDKGELELYLLDVGTHSDLF
ncbi:hypothetical protein FACS189425_09230 [Clostridia bacterium]|nr:hypothetical protein FACS189425_09230 [Clostridia bacterium]